MLPVQLCLQTKPSRKQKHQPHLPHEVLSLVLQRIEQHERLRCCSLVCKAWKAAAAATVTSISMELAPVHSRSLQLWLGAHGGNVMHLSLQNGVGLGRQQLSLPFAQLTQLRSCTLRGCVVRPVNLARPGHSHIAEGSNQRLCGSSSSSSGNILSCLSSLTMLEMSNVTLHGFKGGLGSLSALTALQDLTVGNGFCTEQAASVRGLDDDDEPYTAWDQCGSSRSSHAL
jgi:hypothetical protein